MYGIQCTASLVVFEMHKAAISWQTWCGPDFPIWIHLGSTLEEKRITMDGKWWEFKDVPQGDGREFLNSTGTAMEITSLNRLIMVNRLVGNGFHSKVLNYRRVIYDVGENINCLTNRMFSIFLLYTSAGFVFAVPTVKEFGTWQRLRLVQTMEFCGAYHFGQLGHHLIISNNCNTAGSPTRESS